MKIGCNTVAFRKYDLDFALEKISSAGYRYVEVEANLTWCPHVDPWKDDPVRFKEKVSGYDFIGVSALGSHRELITSEQGIRDIEQALAWCGKAGVPVVLTGEGRMPEGMTIPEALDILKGRLSRLAAVAERHQVCLAIEDHGSISLTPDGLSQIMDLVHSGWLAVNFDTANIHRGDYIGTGAEGYEWKLGAKTSFSETELLRKVADRVRHIHFKDVKGRDAVILGQGEIDLTGCLKILKAAGFDGVLSFESEGWEDAEGAEQMIRASKQYMEDALKAL